MSEKCPERARSGPMGLRVSRSWTRARADVEGTHQSEAPTAAASRTVSKIIKRTAPVCELVGKAAKVGSAWDLPGCSLTARDHGPPPVGWGGDDQKRR